MQRLAQAIGGRSGGDVDLPRLSIAPCGGVLRQCEDALNSGAFHRARLESPTAIPFGQQCPKDVGRRYAGAPGRLAHLN